MRRDAGIDDRDADAPAVHALDAEQTEQPRISGARLISRRRRVGDHRGAAHEEIGSTDFGTTRLPALGGDGGSASSGPVPSAAPGVGNGIGGSDGSQVTIPPAVGATQDHRLPIFDSLESDWFRRSGNASLSSSSAAAAPAAVAAGQTWSSPADEGYRAARVAAEPASDETTTAGLPKRTPRANLVPGSVGGGSGGEETESAPPARSAELPRTKEPVSVAVPPLTKTPPPLPLAPPAELLLIVALRTFRMPPLA